MSSLESRPTQTGRIVDLLRSHKGQWVPLPEILSLGISQYSARIHEARHRWGLDIENRVETVNGKKHSWFRLLESEPEAQAEKHVRVAGLFPMAELERGARWEDHG